MGATKILDYKRALSGYQLASQMAITMN